MERWNLDTRPLDVTILMQFRCKMLQAGTVHDRTCKKTAVLVGGFNSSEKYEFVSWDDELPNIWENKIHVPNHQSLHKPVMTQ